MLTLEDLYVANQAARRGVLPPEAMRELLHELARRPERVQLVRLLHERQGVGLADAKSMFEEAKTYLRRRSEACYLQVARREGLAPAPLLEQLVRQQAEAKYAWTLGERLVREHGVSTERHGSCLQQVERLLQEDERRVVARNVEGGFAPILGAPASGAGPVPGDRAPGVPGRVTNKLSVYAPPPAAAPAATPAELAGTIILDGSGIHARPDAPPEGGGADTNGADAEDAEMTMALDLQALEASGIRMRPPEPTDVASPDAWASARVAPASPPGGDAPPGTVRMAAGEVLPLPGQRPAGPSAAATPFASGAPQPGVAPTGGRGPAAGSGPGGAIVGGRYQLLRELGRGAMGVVHLARDPERDAPVALKVVQGPATEEVRGRFKREILVSQRIHHEHVIEVLDAGELEDGSSYMVMEVLEGESLKALLDRERAQPVERALALLEQLLLGLAAVHRAQVVHRDIKPENVQVGQRDGRDALKIVDFGISRFLDQEIVAQENVFMTVKGQLSGTPIYVAPEAILDPELVAPGHDVYASGVILYELLTGTLPFSPSRSLRDLLADTVHSRPRDLNEANPERAPYPKPLERLVRRLLEKDAELRPADASAALALLREVREELEGKGGGDAQPKAGFTARMVRRITSFFGKKPVAD